MIEVPQNFDLEMDNLKLKVQRHSIANQVIYRVNFSDKRTPLVVTRASKDTAERFWTSIPKGRQREAEQVGDLIAEYIKSNI